MERLDNGRPLREALRTRGLSLARVAELTRDADPEGRGVAVATLGFLVATGSSARETCTERVAHLIAEALDMAPEMLFSSPDIQSFGMPGLSTDRGTQSTKAGSGMPDLADVAWNHVSAQRMADILQMHVRTLHEHTKADPDFPHLKAGRKYKYHPATVLAYLAAKSRAA